MYPGRNTPIDKIKTPVLNAVSLIFKTLSFFNLKRKARRPREFPALIVSIDNLSFGGTGKTTLVTEIGTQLEKRNIKFAVVTRGYKSKYEQTGTRVQPTHDFTDVGDEAEIYKTRFPGRDIYVGKDREKSIENAVADNNKIILLDDGFQTTNIRKDITVMLLNPRHPYYYLRNFKFLTKKKISFSSTNRRGRQPRRSRNPQPATRNPQQFFPPSAPIILSPKVSSTPPEIPWIPATLPYPVSPRWETTGGLRTTSPPLTWRNSPVSRITMCIPKTR